MSSDDAGMVMWEIAARALPWDYISHEENFLDTLLDRLREGERPTLSPQWPYAYVELLEKCWEFVATDRVTFAYAEESLRGMLYGRQAR